MFDNNKGDVRDDKLDPQTNIADALFSIANELRGLKCSVQQPMSATLAEAVMQLSKSTNNISESISVQTKLDNSGLL